MFPLFDEISSGGNALDRVLALEIELAEALKTKNKSNTLFQRLVFKLIKFSDQTKTESEVWFLPVPVLTEF